MAKKESTIIIKKIKKGGHGHHGGAWKVAYADFVTAMMAFFLLMWLLNATEAESLSGLADYFAPTIGIKDEMGIGFMGGKSALSFGLGADKSTNRGIIFGGVPTGPIIKVMEKIEIVTDETDAERIAIMIGGNMQKENEEPTEPTSFSKIADALESYVNEIAEENKIEQKIDIFQNIEGLHISIENVRGDSMFEGQTAILKPEIETSFQKLANILSHLPNYISITGHTSSIPVFGKENYSNWELSADRANAVRRLLIASGVQPEQIGRIIGKSDNDPLYTSHPDSPANNRVSIILLRESLLPDHKKVAPEGIFLDSESESAKELINDEIDSDIKKIDKKVDETEEGVKKDKLDNVLNTEIFEENDDIITEQVNSEDPFSGGKSSAPTKLLVEEKKEEIKKDEKPVKAYLFEEDDDETEIVE